MEGEFQAPEELLELFEKSYDFAKEGFDEANSTVAEAERTRAKLMQCAESNYRAFKQLAERRDSDGNNVPIVMAAIESRNIAKEVFSMIVNGAVDGKDPDDIIGDISAKVFHLCTGPLNMMCWEKYIGEKIEEAV